MRYLVLHSCFTLICCKTILFFQQIISQVFYRIGRPFLRQRTKSLQEDWYYSLIKILARRNRRICICCRSWCFRLSVLNKSRRLTHSVIVESRKKFLFKRVQENHCSSNTQICNAVVLFIRLLLKKRYRTKKMNTSRQTIQTRHKNL